MQPQQTPEQALQLLDNVCSRVSGTREDHVRIQQAVQTLHAAITLPEEDEALDKSQKDKAKA